MSEQSFIDVPKSFANFRGNVRAFIIKERRQHKCFAVKPAKFLR